MDEFVLLHMIIIVSENSHRGLEPVYKPTTSVVDEKRCVGVWCRGDVHCLSRDDGMEYSRQVRVVYYDLFRMAHTKQWRLKNMPHIPSLQIMPEWTYFNTKFINCNVHCIVA